MEVDLSYYRRRSAEETRAAAGAADAHVRNVHLELVRQYDRRIADLEARLRRADIHLVSAA